MRKETRRIKSVCLLCCLLLLFCTLTACGSKGDGGKKETGGTDGQKTPDSGNGGDAEAGEGEGTDTGSRISFPLAEKETIRVWVEWSNNFCESPNDVKAVAAMEEKTNVHIDWTVVGNSEAQEKYGLMLASGDYPDILCGTHYPSGIIGGVEDGVFLDLTSYMESYMPNYMAIAVSNPDWDKMTKLDDGRRAAVYQANCYNDRIEGENPWIGPAVRKDWLEELNLDTPVTIDDWYQVLTAFKEKYGAFMTLSADGVNYAQDFLSAYGVLGEFYQVDGTVHYGPLEEGYKEYLKTMSGWYQEGLIDPNFTSYNEFTDANKYFANNQAGAGPVIGSSAYAYLKESGMSQDEDFFLQTVEPAVLKEGDTPKYGMSITEFSRYVAISSNCKNPELVLSYLDQYYTKEMMELTSYGIEGESYTKNADGTYAFTDAVLNDPDGRSVADACSLYTMMASQYFGFYNWGYAPPLYGEWLNEAQGTWKTDDSLNLPSNITLTSEETEEYAGLYTSIQTLVQEKTVKYIMGTESFDQYDAFVQSLYDYGIEKCLNIQQAALDRYNAR